MKSFKERKNAQPPLKLQELIRQIGDEALQEVLDSLKPKQKRSSQKKGKSAASKKAAKSSQAARTAAHS